MDSWAIFQWMVNSVDVPLRASVDQIIGALFPGVVGAVRVAMAAWVAMLGYRILWGGGDDPLRHALRDLVYAAAFGSFLTISTYNDYVRDVALDLPNSISNAISGGTFGANSFDDMWGRAWASGVRVWKGASWTDVGVQIMCVLFWICALIAIAAGFVIWMASHVLLNLVVAVGPLSLGFFIFPTTRGFTQYWISGLAGSVATQVLVTTLLAMLLKAETTMLTALQVQVGGNVFEGGRMLFAMAAVFLMCAFLMKDIPGIARAIYGGVYFSTGALSRDLNNKVAAIQSRVAGLGRAGWRAIQPPAPEGANVARRSSPGASLSAS